MVSETKQLDKLNIFNIVDKIVEYQINWTASVV
jgi:hypothetical protein